MTEQKKIQQFVPIIFSLLLFASVAGISNYGILQIINDSIHQTLNEVAQQQSFQLHKEIESDINTLKNISLLLNITDGESLTSQLTLLQPNTGFDSLAYADEQGNLVNQNGGTQNISQSDLFISAMKGETAIADAVQPLLDTKAGIPVAVPIVSEGGIPKGALIGQYTLENLDTLISPGFGGQGKVYLIDRKGNILNSSKEMISTNQHESDTGVPQKMKFISGSDESKIISALERGNPGHTVFNLNGKRWHCHYNPVGFGGWYIFTMVRHDVGISGILAISQKIFITSALMLLCFLLYVGYSLRKSKKRIAELGAVPSYDKLCNCPNLPQFRIIAQRFVDSHPDEKVLMVKLDIGEFKLINNMFGKKTGDFLLMSVADVLRQLTAHDCFARAKDDEFFVLLLCETPEELTGVRNKFLSLLYERLGSDLSYQPKIVAGNYFMSLENCRDVTEAIEKADLAHRKTKELGQETFAYDQEFVRQELWSKGIENRLEQAFANEELQVYLQPQYTLSDESVHSAEALVRWEWEGKMLSPVEFVPILEENGQIIKMDFYMWEQVCKKMRGWVDSGIDLIEISVNFSRKHIVNPNFTEDLCRIADQYQIPHQYLAIELTETAIMENEKALQEITERLHAKGFLVSMDDFGTGYSSLGAFKNMQVDILKIDRSFFVDGIYLTRSKILIASVINMAKELGIISIAEGVEEQEHIDFLREVGCDKVQSYYFERPTPIETFWTREKPNKVLKERPHYPVIIAMREDVTEKTEKSMKA